MLVLSALCLARVLAMDLWMPVILGLLSVISFVAGWRAVKEKKTFLVVVFYPVSYTHLPFHTAGEKHPLVLGELDAVPLPPHEHVAEGVLIAGVLALVQQGLDPFSVFDLRRFK